MLSPTPCEPARLNPYLPGDPQRDAHEVCWTLYRSLPWRGGKAREPMSSCFAFAMSVCHMPRPPGSLGALLDLAFPPGELPNSESGAFLGVARASRALGCPRFHVEDEAAARAVELAPVFIGGLECLGQPVRARCARLSLLQSLIDTTASRLFFDGRAWKTPSREALDQFGLALRACLRIEWPQAEPSLAPRSSPMGAGPASGWPAAIAARERIASMERRELALLCPEASSAGRSRL